MSVRGESCFYHAPRVANRTAPVDFPLTSAGVGSAALNRSQELSADRLLTGVALITIVVDFFN